MGSLGRMVIAASGAINHELLVKCAQEKFSSISKQSKNKNVILEPACFTSSEFEERWDEMDRAYYAFAYPTPGWNHPDVLPLMFFHQLLGEWDVGMGSAENSAYILARLYYSSPGDPQVDKYFAFNTLYNDIGLFGIYMVAHPFRIQEAILTSRYIMNVIGNSVSSWQLELARNKLKSNILFSLDNTAQITEDIGRQLLTYGRRIHPTELLARIDNVDVNSVRTVIQKYFVNRDHTSVALGAIYEIPDYDKIRKQSYNLRL